MVCRLRLVFGGRRCEVAPLLHEALDWKYREDSRGGLRPAAHARTREASRKCCGVARDRIALIRVSDEHLLRRSAVLWSQSPFALVYLDATLAFRSKSHIL
jgi:hypothetical protein